MGATVTTGRVLSHVSFQWVVHSLDEAVTKARDLISDYDNPDRYTLTIRAEPSFSAGAERPKYWWVNVDADRND